MTAQDSSARAFSHPDAKWNDSIMCRLMGQIHAGVTGTRVELAERINASERSLEAYLAMLHGLGLVRAIAWDRVGGSFRGTYGFGEGKRHHPRPTKASKGIKYGVEVACSDVAKRYMLLLRKGHNTALKMAMHTGSSTSWARKILRSLHTQGFAHISGWDRDGSRPPVAIYAPGRGEDTPRPRKRTMREANAARKRKLADRYGEGIAKRILTPRKDGGPERIVVDGRTVWQRGKPRGGRKVAA